jgi:hypothetical protein
LISFFSHKYIEKADVMKIDAKLTLHHEEFQGNPSEGRKNEREIFTPLKEKNQTKKCVQPSSIERAPDKYHVKRK